jgi:hypothetical protein
MRQRGNGEGSIYQRSSDGRWLGVLTVGYSPRGSLVRKSVSATTNVRPRRGHRTWSHQATHGLRRSFDGIFNNLLGVQPVSGTDQPLLLPRSGVPS